MTRSTVILTFCLSILSFSFLQAQYVDSEIIIKFANGVSAQDQQDFLDNYLATKIDEDAESNLLIQTPPLPFTTQDGQYILNMVDLIGAIDDEAEIDDTDFNYLVTPTPLNLNDVLSYLNMPDYSPIDPACESTYPGGSLMGCDCQPHSNTPSQPVKIGIIDTGVDTNHEDLMSFVQYGIDVTHPDYDGTEPELEGHFPPLIYQQLIADQNGHGTSVAGIITGLCDRVGLTSDDIGIVVFKAFADNGQGTLFNIKKALDAAASFDLDIINLSWSYRPDQSDPAQSTVVHRSLMALSNNQNVILVAGAGNDGQLLANYDIAPADLSNIDHLITVGSVDCDGAISSFSNYGNKVEIYAPGEEIISPITDGYWALNNQGTSFSTAIVTVTIAQISACIAKNSGAGAGGGLSGFGNPFFKRNQVEQIKNILLSSAAVVSTTEPSPFPLVSPSEDILVVDFAAACMAAGANNSNGLSGPSLLVDSNSSEQVDDVFLNEERRTYPETNSAIEVYPNPVQEKLTIQIGEFGTNESASIELLTLTGQKIRTTIQNQIESSGSIEFDLSDLPKGSYLLKIQKGKKSWSDLIVKS